MVHCQRYRDGFFRKLLLGLGVRMFLACQIRGYFSSFRSILPEDFPRDTHLGYFVPAIKTLAFRVEVSGKRIRDRIIGRVSREAHLTRSCRNPDLFGWFTDRDRL